MATAIAQLAGAFGTMGIVRANLESPERGIIFHGGVPVVWMSNADFARRFVWWQRGRALGEQEELRRGPSMGGTLNMYTRGDPLTGHWMRPESPAPWWCRANDPREVALLLEQDFEQWDDMRYDYAVGWPWPAFRYEEDRVATFDGTRLSSVGRPRLGHALEPRMFTAGGVATAFDKNFLTWNPIWPGLIASTSFWGLASFLLSVGLSGWRRRRRLARGRCPSCGYDKRGLDANAACPECGASGPTGQSLP